MLSNKVLGYLSLDDDQIDASEIPQTLANGIGKDYKLLDIVKELGSSLTSDDDRIRTRGIQLLSAIVQHLDAETTDRQSTITLTSFFCSKLAEKQALEPCIQALSSLMTFSKFGVGDGMQVAQSVFESVQLSSYPQATRFHVYKLFDELMTRHRRSLQRMGADFIRKYCEMVEGEKDPRNLMISFSVVKIILLEFDVADTVEALFDITFCYFPITFTPPPDDFYGITSEDLIQSLRSCLASTGAFGPLALPLFMDKLQAASEKAKRQTLQALIACFPVYGPASVGEWADRFSEALWIEVFHATDDSMMELALEAYAALFKTLYPDQSAAKLTSDDMEVDIAQVTGVKGVAEKVTKNCLNELEEPDKSNAKPAVRILSTMVGTSARVAQHVLAASLSKLVSMLKDQDLVPLRPSLIESITELLKPLTTIDKDRMSETVVLAVAKFKDDLLSLLSSGSRTASSSSQSIDGLVVLVKVPMLLEVDDVAYAVSAINDVVASSRAGDDSYEAALDALVEIAPLAPKTLEESTLPALFSKLPSEAPPASSETEAEYHEALEALSAICLPADLFEIFVLRLTARLEAVCQQTVESNARNSLFAHHLLGAIYVTMANKVVAGHVDIPKYMDRFVPRLFSIFIVPTLQGPGGQVALDPRLLVDAGKIVTIVNQSLTLERQSQFSEALNKAFHDGDLSLLLPSAVNSELPFRPLHDDGPEPQKDLVILFGAAIVSMRPDTAVSDEQVSGFLKSFLERSSAVKSAAQLDSIAQLIGSTVNKRAQGLKDFVDEAMPAFWKSQVASPQVRPAVRRASLKVAAWVAKALVVRSDTRGYQFVDEILALFSDSDLATDAARSLRLVADESDRILSKENFAVIRLLYKQRFFSYVLPKLVEGHKSAIGDEKDTYLVGLSGILQYMPKQLSTIELPKLLPLLITSLDLPDPALRANVINALRSLVAEAPETMEASISSIALKALSAYHDKTSTPSLRIAALDFLAVLPDKIPYPILHPNRANILKDLGQAIDDPRKEVRKAAVSCRSKWYMYHG